MQSQRRPHRSLRLTMGMILAMLLVVSTMLVPASAEQQSAHRQLHPDSLAHQRHARQHTALHRHMQQPHKRRWRCPVATLLFNRSGRKGATSSSSMQVTCSQGNPFLQLLSGPGSVPLHERPGLSRLRPSATTSLTLARPRWPGSSRMPTSPCSAPTSTRLSPGVADRPDRAVTVINVAGQSIGVSRPDHRGDPDHLQPRPRRHLH